MVWILGLELILSLFRWMRNDEKPTFCRFRIANIHRYLSIFVPNASQMFIKKSVNLSTCRFARQTKATSMHPDALFVFIPSRLIIAYYISQMNNFSWSIFASGIHSNRLLLVPIEWFLFYFIFIYLLPTSEDYEAIFVGKPNSFLLCIF